jgi:hypothetical protein
MTTHSRMPAERSGFLGAWERLVGPRGVPTLARRRGRPPRVPLSQLLPALIFHVMQDTGTLSEHFSQVFDDTLADSSWADRRARLPWEIFAALMRRVLRPKATRRHSDAFWRGWRLVALDGTQFSLTNTPQITARRTKARTRRGRAAFAKIWTAVLLEVGLHNPLAAAIGRDGESEWALAQRLLAQLPTRAVLLGDRLYGVAAFVVHARAACTRVGSHFLLRASRSTKPRVIKRLRDGTRLVQIALRARNRPAQILEWLEVREIRVRVGRPGHRAHELRLWTSLVDATTAPALELAQLYAHRWEHELYFREVKRQVRKTDLLQSHTVETAAQEIAALPGQRAARGRAAARRRWADPGLAHELPENSGALRETDVVVSRCGARHPDRHATHADHDARLRADAPVCDATSTRAHLSTRRPSADPGVAAGAAGAIHQRTHAVSTRVATWSRISERH